MDSLKGKRTYITAVVIFIVAVLQFFNVINWNQETFTTVLAALGSLAAVFLRAGINEK